jgi:hypothetical protein
MTIILKSKYPFFSGYFNGQIILCNVLQRILFCKPLNHSNGEKVISTRSAFLKVFLAILRISFTV